MPAPLALLRPVRLEVATGTKRGYVWRDGYQVVNPESGLPMFPYMTRRAARAFCKAQGWRCKEA